MTDKECRQLAIDIVEGRVFGTWDFPENECNSMIGSVFMPVLFLSDEDRQQLVDKKVIYFYEYYNAGTISRMSVNGYPIFASFHTLTEGDWPKVVASIDAYKTQKRSFLEQS